MEQAQLILQILGDIILVATLAVIVWYTVKTAEMAAATKLSAESAQQTVEEMREARDQENAPYVICYFDAAVHDQLIYFVVKNFGKSVAHNVRLGVSPSLTTSHGPLEDLVLLTEGVASLAPGQEISTLFDSTMGIFGRDGLPLRYTARITYSGGVMGRERVSDQTLDLAPYRGLFYTLEKGVPDLVKAVEGVKDYFGKADGHLRDISDRLNKGLWLQNPDLAISAPSAAADIARGQLLAKLREVQLVWETSLRDDENDIIPFRLDLQSRVIVLSHQVLTFLASAKDVLTPDLESIIARIVSSLLELGTMKFYIDGGRSIKQFNEAGEALAGIIRNVISKLQTEAAPTESPQDPIQSPPAPGADVEPDVGENTNRQSDSTADGEQ